MSNNNQGENLEVFFIPPNFLTSGRLFGGMLRIRNAVEAGVLALGTAIPISWRGECRRRYNDYSLCGSGYPPSRRWEVPVPR